MRNLPENDSTRHLHSVRAAHEVRRGKASAGAMLRCNPLKQRARLAQRTPVQALRPYFCAVSAIVPSLPQRKYVRAALIQGHDLTKTGTPAVVVPHGLMPHESEVALQVRSAER